MTGKPKKVYRNGTKDVILKVSRGHTYLVSRQRFNAYMRTYMRQYRKARKART